MPALEAVGLERLAIAPWTTTEHVARMCRALAGLPHLQLVIPSSADSAQDYAEGAAIFNWVDASHGRAGRACSSWGGVVSALGPLAGKLTCLTLFGGSAAPGDLATLASVLPGLQSLYLFYVQLCGNGLEGATSRLLDLGKLYISPPFEQGCEEVAAAVVEGLAAACAVAERRACLEVRLVAPEDVREACAAAWQRVREGLQGTNRVRLTSPKD